MAVHGEQQGIVGSLLHAAAGNPRPTRRAVLAALQAPRHGGRGAAGDPLGGPGAGAHSRIMDIVRAAPKVENS